MKKLIHRLTRYPTKPSDIAQYLNTTPQKNPYSRNLGFTPKHMGIPVLHGMEIHEKHSQHCTSIGVHTNKNGQPLFCTHTRPIGILPSNEQVNMAYNVYDNRNNKKIFSEKDDYLKEITHHLFFKRAIQLQKDTPNNANTIPWTIQQIIFRRNRLSQHEHIQYIRTLKNIEPYIINCGELCEKPLTITSPYIIFIPQNCPPNIDKTLWEAHVKEYNKYENMEHCYYLLTHPQYMCIAELDTNKNQWYIQSFRQKNVQK